MKSNLMSNNQSIFGLDEEQIAHKSHNSSADKVFWRTEDVELK